MQRYNDILKQSGIETNTPKHYRRLPYLAAIVLTLVTLACASVGTTSDGIVVLTRLPTLTRTPLPTLTPTSSSASVAIVSEVESLESAPTLAFQPESAPVALNISSTSSASLPADTIVDVSSTPDISVVNTDVGIINEFDSSSSLDTPAVPTDTPTSTPTVTPTETPVPSSTPTETPLPTSTPTPTATPTPLPKDWLFNAVQIYPDPDKDRLLLYGNLVNNTDLPQELISIVGTFTDEQGEVIATTDLTNAYWPGFVMSPGGSMPFELKVKGIASAADYTLSVEAEPSGDVPRENFEFSDLKQEQDGDEFCVEGKFKNPGDGLRDYLVLTAVLFNGQDNVVNFGHYSEYYSEGAEGASDFEFDLCADSLDQEITRFELHAWGL